MNDSRDENPVSRRSVLWTAGAAGAGIGLGAVGTGGAAAAAAPESAAEDATSAAQDAPKRQGRTMAGVPFERRSTVRVGINSLGGTRGVFEDYRRGSTSDLGRCSAVYGGGEGRP